MQYKRLMGIDYGEVRIGIAFSDLLQIICSPFETYKRTTEEQDIKHIVDLVNKQEVETIVFGLPLNMDGTEGERAQKTRDFASKVAQFVDAKIEFYDERLSSVEAEELLISANVKRQERKNLIDKVAAQIILESYLNSNKKRS